MAEGMKGCLEVDGDKDNIWELLLGQEDDIISIGKSNFRGV